MQAVVTDRRELEKTALKANYNNNKLERYLYLKYCVMAALCRSGCLHGNVSRKTRNFLVRKNETIKIMARSKKSRT